MFILDDAGVVNDSAPAVNPNAGGEAEPEGLPPNDPDGESTTPEEVAKVMKSSGIDIAGEEEGDDPDAAEEDESGESENTDTEEEDKTETEEAEEEPEVKPEEETKDEPETADDTKYSFTVEDANGVTFKITAGAKLEDILKEFEPKNNGQIIDILHSLDKVESAKDSDDKKAVEDAAKAELTERTNKLLENWTGEAKELQAQKRIADGEDGEARISEVYKFMATENDKRMSAGKPTLNSFEDALDKLEAKEAREAKVEQDKKDKEDARKNGGLVGGSSAPASSSSGTYKGGARNANEALRQVGLLK